MADQNNVIELVVKLTDQVSKPLDELRSKVGELAKFALAAGGVFGFVEALKKVVEVSADAEDAISKFDLAFKNLGGTLGRTRDDLLNFAQESGKSSIFDSQSVLRAETALLRFKSVTGDTFDRARRDTLDLASAMKIDLTSAAEIVGRAIERPEIALRQLRAAGITFTTSQEDTVKILAQTGDRAGAAAIVLGELEKRFRGAADAAAHTLTGAIERTKHAFDSLFETDPGPMTAAFNSLADTLNDPAVRDGIQTIVTGLATIIEYATKAAALLGKIGKGLAIAASGGLGDNEQVNADTRVRQIQAQIDNLKSSPFNRIDDTGQDAKRREVQMAALQAQLSAAQAYYAEVSKAAEDAATAQTAAAKKAAAANDNLTESFRGLEQIVVKETLSLPGFYQDLNDATETAAEKSGAAFEKIKAQLNQLLNDKQISPEQFAARWKEAMEDGLQPVIVTIKKRFTQPLQTDFEIALNNMVQDFETAMGRMLDNGKFTWRDLGTYFLHEVEAGIFKKAMIELQALIANAFKSTSTSSGWGKIFGSILGSIFGGTATSSGSNTPPSSPTGPKLPPFASGGWGSGLALVGDDGPELVNLGSGGQVYNRRQMAAMGLGGGSTVNIGGTSIVVQGNTDDRSLLAVKQYVDVSNARQSRELLRILERNGVRRPV